MEEILRIEHVSKRFGNFYANKDISFTLNKGEILTLLGENGAGKSTLMNVLSGLFHPTEGKIFVKGKEMHFASPSDATAAGIGMVHQHFMLVDAMSVFDNIILGERRSSSFFINRKDRRAEIEELMKNYGLQVDLDKNISDISVGEQQRVEILKALYHGADILILDEPSAVLTDVEVKGLYLIMTNLVNEGKSIIFISHKMREVLYISNRIAILRNGQLIDIVDCEKSTETDLATLMIGHELKEAHYEKVESNQEDVLSMENVSYNSSNKHNSLRGIDFSVRRGEIVGIAGVDGNGQTQIAQIASGVIRPEDGTVVIKGKKISIFDPRKFIDDNVSHISEDRNLQGLIGEMSVSENIVLKKTDDSQFSFAKGMKLKKSAIKEYAKKMVEKYDIRLSDVLQPAKDLSGGNQQKVVLSREIESKPDLLIAAHPSRGLDVGATRFVHDRIVDARNQGSGVLLISADFDEIVELSDRIIVLFEGQKTGEFSGKEIDLEKISLAMTGNRKEASV